MLKTHPQPLSSARQTPRAADDGNSSLAAPVGAKAAPKATQPVNVQVSQLSPTAAVCGCAAATYSCAAAVYVCAAAFHGWYAAVHGCKAAINGGTASAAHVLTRGACCWQGGLRKGSPVSGYAGAHKSPASLDRMGERAALCLAREMFGAWP
eukprot:2541394-Rhodomonas_salina.3